MNASTVYPARTVTAFSSMLTGAPPKVHGMGSNFVPNLGVKCESIFDSLRASGMTGKLVGIAHLVDAFGDRDVETVTAVTDNDEIDEALAARGRAVIQRDDPDLLVLQLLSVDQTGHARGSYNSEYLAKIEETDRVIERFLNWCESTGRRITDGQTGFRAFSRRALECAEIIHDYNYAQVLTLDLLKKGMRMREVPISYRVRANDCRQHADSAAHGDSTDGRRPAFHHDHRQHWNGHRVRDRHGNRDRLWHSHRYGSGADRNRRPEDSHRSRCRN